MRLLLFLFFTTNLIAQEEYSFRVAYGEASTKDLGEILSFNSDRHPDNLSVFALDGGYLLKEEIYKLPLDLYLKGGLSYFNEGRNQEDVYEVTLYVKLYYKIDFWQNRLRFGLGEGFSYTSDVLWTEYEEARRENDNYAQFLNYLDISVDIDLGKLVGYEPLEDTYLAWTIKHRSGVAGLYSGVYGGSNYNTVSIEKNF